MTNIHILCVEDEPEVLEAVIRDLVQFEKVFPVETARSAEEAREVMREIHDRDGKIGLILCDHIMPGDTGVELMVEMQSNPDTRATRKVLLTGQAGLDATVRAVNQAKLNHYLGKPWSREELHAVVRKELTEFVLAEEADLMPYMSLLDADRLTEAMRTRGVGDR